ncbi:MAG: flagellar biosynthesis protein FlhF [Lachnospiraceae bacterium]|nr:flagellar biosynthesis protein FlhF [Lachnospiraceae bacterium]
MIIKKYIGKTENEAVEAAKRELGEGVVIMNVKDVKRRGILALFGSKQVEVTVALEEENVQAYSRDNAAKRSKAESAVKNGGGIISQGANTENIEKKLDSLQILLENQLKKSDEEKKAAIPQEMVEDNTISSENTEENADETAEKESKSDYSERERFIRLLYNTMLDNEVDEKYANQMLEDIDKVKKPNMPFDYILANIYQKMVLKFGKSAGITPAEKGTKVVLFIGPTGVGKTTTIAKIASNYSMEKKKKIALLTTDTYRIAAADQLRTYANILEVPFRVIYTEEEFCNAVADFGDYDYIFVDTAGHSHKNDEQLQKMQSMLEAVKAKAECQSFLVLSAVTKYSDLLKIAEKYSEITEYQLIFTKLDETNAVGNILNIKLQTDATIAYVTYGQNVPDDIETFNPQKTVKQLLGGK